MRERESLHVFLPSSTFSSSINFRSLIRLCIETMLKHSQIPLLVLHQKHIFKTYLVVFYVIIHLRKALMVLYIGRLVVLRQIRSMICGIWTKLDSIISLN